ncbi:hypothetical protein Prudu_015047 [Prunus dulcis]|uniref:Replication factor-A protein 1 N-terminal domain-containing protein n=1 Tax=Prunus dulcis TaxID=3755 RepID=A0A4Y1RJE9_PRUDU|nr:hypothetical protein Prudu_015047 [Prunus dulcis]
METTTGENSKTQKFAKALERGSPQIPKHTERERKQQSERERGLRMAKLGPTPDAISTILACPDPSGSVERPDIVIQVLDLGPRGITYKFTASDGKMKLKGMFSSQLASQITSGNIQNLGLVRILDYAVNEIPGMSEKSDPFSSSFLRKSIFSEKCLQQSMHGRGFGTVKRATSDIPQFQLRRY